MNHTEVSYKREVWVDNMKVIACILVVLGHFFQGMAKSNILSANDLYEWLKQTIYLLHVPLFLICSGYLYQRLSRVNDIHSWGRNVFKKVLALGVPYSTFSSVTWLLKTFFSESVGNEIGGLFETLFLNPALPYWHLYCLLFIFLVTPTFKSARMAIVGLAFALAAKTVSIIGGEFDVWVQGWGRVECAILKLLLDEIWFVLRICLYVAGTEKIRKRFLGVIGIGVLLASSIAAFYIDRLNGWFSSGLGFFACASIVVLVIGCTDGNKQNRIMGFLIAYIMPIFIMCTLFTASFRSVLLKIGIGNAAVHVIVGILVSFIGPIILAEIMKKLKLDFLLYPGKYTKIGS